MVNNYENVYDCKLVNILTESNGLRVAVKFFMDESTPIRLSHLLSEILEARMLEFDPSIVQCTIHAEPYIDT
ncbi:MAG: hypothetical protein GF364_08695 [Candidatus Lokiarchaeota archaeon]|nr:hypothetical protein [Candidatus Lokiarchaeota archaeon]